MFNQRHRPVVQAVAAMAVIWLLAVAGYRLAQSSQITADKVRAYEESVDFARLTGADRARALSKLEAMLNALSLDERHQVWSEIMRRWFAHMTETEKGQFVEATLPTGFKQSLNAFEQLPPERRRKTIDNALKNLKDAQGQLASGAVTFPPNAGTNAPVLSPELEDKIKTIGLKSYYSQGSAETRAELAPVLEEMQRVMEMSRRNNGP